MSNFSSRPRDLTKNEAQDDRSEDNLQLTRVILNKYKSRTKITQKEWKDIHAKITSYIRNINRALEQKSVQFPTELDKFE